MNSLIKVDLVTSRYIILFYHTCCVEGIKLLDQSGNDFMKLTFLWQSLCYQSSQSTNDAF